MTPQERTKQSPLSVHLAWISGAVQGSLSQMALMIDHSALVSSAARGFLPMTGSLLYTCRERKH